MLSVRKAAPEAAPEVATLGPVEGELSLGSVTAGLPKRPRWTSLVKEAALDVVLEVASPGPVEGEVSIGVNLDVDSTVEGQRLQTEDQATLAGKEGAWLVRAIDSAAQGKTVRLFFARASR